MEVTLESVRHLGGKMDGSENGRCRGSPAESVVVVVVSGPTEWLVAGWPCGRQGYESRDL